MPLFVAFFRAFCLILQLMPKIDRTNEKILQALSQDGRISNLELADMVGLSPSACLRRVQELERTGVITGYRAILNREALGAGFTAYVAVGLNNHSQQSQKAFEKAVGKAPEVRECHNVTGTIEYLLRVEVADLKEYKTFHTDMLGTLPQVSSLTSFIVMESPKDARA